VRVLLSWVIFGKNIEVVQQIVDSTTRIALRIDKGSLGRYRFRGSSLNGSRGRDLYIVLEDTKGTGDEC